MSATPPAPGAGGAVYLGTPALQAAANKWQAKTSTAANKWATNTANFGPANYVQGVSNKTGIPIATVQASAPAVNYANFARNAASYSALYAQGVQGKANKWLQKYLAAFQTPAYGAPAAPAAPTYYG